MAYLSVALAALGEELFFRGYLLQYALDTKEENNLIKNIFFSTLASFLFSIAHMRFDLFIYLSIFLFFIDLFIDIY